MAHAYWIITHLQEARDQLTQAIEHLQLNPDDDVSLSWAMQHTYQHLNTAWNTRNLSDEQIAAGSDDDFDTWRTFPTDLHLTP